MREKVIVHQRTEAALVAVPNVPDKGSMLKQRAMLFEEFVSQPLF